LAFIAKQKAADIAGIDIPSSVEASPVGSDVPVSVIESPASALPTE